MSESQPGQSAPDPSPESVASTRDAEQQTRIAASPFELSQEPVTPEGPAAPTPAGAVPAPAYEHLGELPANYGTQSVYLVAYDPRQLFAYWDVDWTTAGDAAHALRVCRPDGEVEDEVAISSADTGRYLTAGRPGGTYYVELGRRGRDGGWQGLAVSGRVTMPPEGLAGESEAKFATLPFHLSFQRLLELIQGAMGRGEDLTAALARLQRGTPPSETATLLNALDGLNGEQLHTLEMLLGQKFNVSSGPAAGSGGATAILRDRHEALSSGGAFGSESLASGGGFGSESLSSGLLAAGAGGQRGAFVVGVRQRTRDDPRRARRVRQRGSFFRRAGRRLRGRQREPEQRRVRQRDVFRVRGGFEQRDAFVVRPEQRNARVVHGGWQRGVEQRVVAVGGVGRRAGQRGHGQRTRGGVPAGVGQQLGRAQFVVQRGEFRFEQRVQPGRERESEQRGRVVAPGLATRFSFL